MAQQRGHDCTIDPKPPQRAGGVTPGVPMAPPSTFLATPCTRHLLPAFRPPGAGGGGASQKLWDRISPMGLGSGGCFGVGGAEHGPSAPPQRWGMLGGSGLDLGGVW